MAVPVVPTPTMWLELFKALSSSFRFSGPVRGYPLTLPSGLAFGTLTGQPPPTFSLRDSCSPHSTGSLTRIPK